MEKGWIVQIALSEQDYDYAFDMVERRLSHLLEEVKYDIERSVRVPFGRAHSELKKRKWGIDAQLRQIQERVYRPWVAAYPFRAIPLQAFSWWGDTWVQGKLYDLIDLPVYTTTLDRCVELLKDLRGVQKDSRFRIFNIETKEEIPSEFIIEA